MSASGASSWERERAWGWGFNLTPSSYPSLPPQLHSPSVFHHGMTQSESLHMWAPDLKTSQNASQKEIPSVSKFPSQWYPALLTQKILARGRVGGPWKLEIPSLWDLKDAVYAGQVFRVARKPRVTRHGLMVTIFLSKLVFGSMIVNLKWHFNTCAK